VFFEAYPETLSRLLATRRYYTERDIRRYGVIYTVAPTHGRADV